MKSISSHFFLFAKEGLSYRPMTRRGGKGHTVFQERYGRELVSKQLPPFPSRKVGRGPTAVERLLISFFFVLDGSVRFCRDVLRRRRATIYDRGGSFWSITFSE